MTTESAPWASSFAETGGEAGRLIAAHDWSDTELGPIEHWPAHLRAAVGTMLVSKAQIVMFWGRALVTLYNDAYLPVLGSQHPASLMCSNSPGWAPLARRWKRSRRISST